MNGIIKVVCIVAVAGLPQLAMAAADTLVVKGEDGKFQAGAAKSWKGAGTTTTFALAKGVDCGATAKLLGERLFNATCSCVGNDLKVEGVKTDALLDQVAAISLSGEGGGDPLADLAGLGAVAIVDTPEGGGSIRASKPMATARPRIIKEHDPAERVSAEVVEVKRGEFPKVILKIKLRSSAKAGPLEAKLRKGKVLEAPVILAASQAGVDFGQEATQRNLSAYYLTRGDRITVHVIAGKGASVELDYVERRQR